MLSSVGSGILHSAYKVQYTLKYLLWNYKPRTEFQDSHNHTLPVNTGKFSVFIPSEDHIKRHLPHINVALSEYPHNSEPTLRLIQRSPTYTAVTMDTLNSDINNATTQQPSKKRRNSRAKKKHQEEEEEVDPVEKLVAHGWARKDNVSANKVFLCGPLVVSGRLHATDKLCLRGDFHVTDKVECEGNFTLFGTITCRYVRGSIRYRLSDRSPRLPSGHASRV